MVLASGAQADDSTRAVRSQDAPASATLSGAQTAFRYDTDYPTIPYNGTATDNAVARLQAQLDRGVTRLEFRAPRGYLDSLLAALKIDASSQTLVYSKTSLQIEAISAATPRAIYFNDDTYVAWVQGDRMLEIVTMDAKLGAVFYTLPNHPGAPVRLVREASRCLTCHDTYSMAGGGVPQFRFTSTLVDVNGATLSEEPGIETTDETPLAERWAGWFVSGRSGQQAHLGNILVRNAKEMDARDLTRREDFDSLDGLLDVRPYLTNTSDIVALLVLEHQTYLHNLITRANFKSRTLLAKTEPGDSVEDLTWNGLSSKSQLRLQRLLEPMVHAMLFIDAASIRGKIASTSNFDRWFQAQPPRDRQGRSLRELDLTQPAFQIPPEFSDLFAGLRRSARLCQRVHLYETQRHPGWAGAGRHIRRALPAGAHGHPADLDRYQACLRTGGGGAPVNAQGGHMDLIATDRREQLIKIIREETGIDEALIEQLVRSFYVRVREDACLGPIFAARIAEWEPHLQRMCAFWSSIALMSGRYHGQPMRVHLPLPIDARYFDRWLALFEATAREVCPPKAAEFFIDRAHRIAQSLEFGVAAARGIVLGKGARLMPAVGDPPGTACDG